jgi:FolB domain-containing protein
MSKIKIADLEVFYCIGVTEEERAKPQRLLLTVEIEYDFASAALSDRIQEAINYGDVAADLISYGRGRTWNLLEKLVSNLADLILEKYNPQAVLVEVKKFVIPQAQYISVSLVRTIGRQERSGS